MPRYKLVVMTKPAEGREEEYNDWYQNVHLKDVVSIDGFKSAQRFRLSQPVTTDPAPPPYLAIYDLDTDDLGAPLKELTAASASGRMVISTAMSVSFAAIYEDFGTAVKSPKA